jgi:acetyl esterase
LDAEPTEKASLSRRLRLALYGAILNGGIGGIMTLVKWLPYGRRQLAGVTIRRNVAYRETGLRAHTLDITRPRDADGPLPVVVYFHGGGFAYLSKDSHWLMGTLFANHGCVVVNANYRLAPQHRFPAAMEDAVEVLEWVADHMEELGGDPDRLVFCGESAGANLALSLTLGACWDRDEPLCERIRATGLVPRVIAPACGMLQVTDTERFAEGGVPPWILDRLAQVSRSYLGRHKTTGDVPLADPLVEVEKAGPPARPLPACFVFCGGRDPILGDSQRLGAAWERLGATVNLQIYPEGHHAFHALLYKPLAKQAWADQLAFLDRHLP